jgi:sulfite reductase alpha subunit-like flavoprotein
MLMSSSSFPIYIHTPRVLPPTVADAKKQTPFPTPCSYRTALTHYVNITGVPSKNVLKEIAEFAANPTQKEFLLEIASHAGKVSIPALVSTCSLAFT